MNAQQVEVIPMQDPFHVQRTILAQLGGSRFIAMTGATKFVRDGTSLGFRIGRNSKRINYVRITLTPEDLYTIEFLWVGARSFQIKARIEGVYADDLGGLFVAQTGMEISL